MKKLGGFKLIVSVISFLSVLIFFSSSTNVHALDTGDVYRNAPEGIELNDYMDFQSEFTNNSGTMKNSAQIFRANSDAYGNKYDIIQLLNDTDQSQLSSIWGKRNYDTGDLGTYGDNFFDLRKHQSISVWLYFGGKDPYDGLGKKDPVNNTVTGLPDGMAFVLQNDARGKNAISYSINSADVKLTPGQTLGVWGSATSDNSILKDPLSIGGGAIKNAFALEFDTLRNNYQSSGKDDYMDGMTGKDGSEVAKGQHIAWGYPGAATIVAEEKGKIPSSFNPANNTYIANDFSGFFGSSKYYYGMNHNGAIPGLYLTGATTLEDAWQHFSFDYEPPDDGSTMATIKYVFNDKNYDGTLKPTNVTDHRIDKIDIKKLQDPNVGGGHQNPNPNMVRWGFTASTGSQKSAPAPFAVVIQEMPNVANVNVTAQLFDLSQYDENDVLGREISDLDTKDQFDTSYDPQYYVANHDKLRFDYNLRYDSGFAGTGTDIATVLNLPKSVNYSPDKTTELGQDGNVGQIIYSNFKNDEDNKTVPIKFSQIKSDGNGNYSLDLTLNKLDEEQENIKIEIFGEASASTTPKTVKAEHVSYKSMRFIDDAMSPSFIIGERFNMSTEDNLDLGTLNTKDPANNQTKVNLTANYENGSNFDTKNFTLYTKVDDRDKTSTVISTADAKNSYDIANDIANSTQFMAESLGTGTHTIKLWAVDFLGRTTDPISYQVKVNGIESKLEVSEKLSFANINHQSTKGYVNRSGEWVVKVTSTGTPWKLTATAAPLTMVGDPTQVVGPMFFRDKLGNDHTLMNDSPIISSYDNADPSPQVTDISNDWGDDDGILLESKGVKKAGKYQSKVNWTLTNSL